MTDTNGQAKRRLPTLHPMHGSVMKRHERIRPVGMDRIAMPHEARQAVERIALEIFTDMTNSGATLQQTLSAIYLSGLQHGSQA